MKEMHLTHSITQSLTHSLTYLLTYLLNHLLTYLLTYLFTYLPTYLHTYILREPRNVFVSSLSTVKSDPWYFLASRPKACSTVNTFFIIFVCFSRIFSFFRLNTFTIYRVSLKLRYPSFSPFVKQLQMIEIWF